MSTWTRRGLAGLCVVVAVVGITLATGAFTDDPRTVSFESIAQVAPDAITVDGGVARVETPVSLDGECPGEPVAFLRVDGAEATVLLGLAHVHQGTQYCGGAAFMGPLTFVVSLPSDFDGIVRPASASLEPRVDGDELVPPSGYEQVAVSVPDWPR